MLTLAYDFDLVPEDPPKPDPTPSGIDLQLAFSGQARLLAERADRGLPIDARSLRNLLALYREIVTVERVA